MAAAILFLLAGLLEEFNWLPLRVIEGISSASVLEHFDALRRGVIALKDVFYFVSIMVLMLFSTNIVLQQKAAR